MMMIDLHGGNYEDRSWQMWILRIIIMVMEDAGDNDGDDNVGWWLWW